MDTLSPEIMLHLMERLDYPRFMSLSLVCRYFSDVGKDLQRSDKFWHRLVSVVLGKDTRLMNERLELDTLRKIATYRPDKTLLTDDSVLLRALLRSSRREHRAAVRDYILQAKKKRLIKDVMYYGMTIEEMENDNPGFVAFLRGKCTTFESCMYISMIKTVLDEAVDPGTIPCIPEGVFDVHEDEITVPGM